MEQKSSKTPALAPGTKGRRPALLPFVLRYGLLGWGLVSAFFYFGVETFRDPAAWLGHAAYAFSVFPLVGAGAGLLLWLFTGRRKR